MTQKDQTEPTTPDKAVEGGINPLLKYYSGFDPETPDGEVREYWELTFPTEIEKPCGILLWCPYGPLVEDFPLHGSGEWGNGPLAEPESCMIFGHDCPAFYVSEPFADPEAVLADCLCDDCLAELRSSQAGETE